MIPDRNYTFQIPTGQAPQSGLRQSIDDAQSQLRDKLRDADALRATEAPRVPTLLDQAQRTRQLLLTAIRMLHDVLNDQECNDVGIERGIDQPHDSLTQEIELTQMLVGGLADRISDLQRRVGQL